MADNKHGINKQFIFSLPLIGSYALSFYCSSSSNPLQMYRCQNGTNFFLFSVTDCALRCQGRFQNPALGLSSISLKTPNLIKFLARGEGED
jgi:hypothetical protein